VVRHALANYVNAVLACSTSGDGDAVDPSTPHTAFRSPIGNRLSAIPTTSYQ